MIKIRMLSSRFRRNVELRSAFIAVIIAWLMLSVCSERAWTDNPNTIGLPIQPVEIALPESSPTSGTTPNPESQDQRTLAISNTGDLAQAWWLPATAQPLLDRPNWVTFDLETILLDTLGHSPRVQRVSRQTSIAMERIVQQDAAFDSNLLFETRAGRKNDPVGNTLTTGGPPRLIEDSLIARAGVQRTSRRGTVIDLSQELGLLDSNSTFFSPTNQGNSRLSLSLTQPLLDRGGNVYNERLLTQAYIDSRVSWQEMRGVVEQRIAEVALGYCKLYELRCHLIQSQQLLERGQEIQSVLLARRRFDAGDIELAKARGRVARRADRVLTLRAEVQKQQVVLAQLVGSDVLSNASSQLELIPIYKAPLPIVHVLLRDAVMQGIENRAEVRAASASLESAALSISVTRAELVPQLTAVIDAYLAGLNGNNRFLTSFGDQFSEGGPGISGALQYELPYGRRASRSRHREAHHRYQQRSEELREAILTTRAEVELALIDVNTSIAQQRTKLVALQTAIEEETILDRRWRLMGGDGAAVGTVLETLLDAQQRRTDAEQQWTSAQCSYRSSLIELQRTMGTLLMNQQMAPIQDPCDTTIHFVQREAEAELSYPQPEIATDTDVPSSQHIGLELMETTPIEISTPDESRGIEPNGMPQRRTDASSAAESTLIDDPNIQAFLEGTVK